MINILGPRSIFNVGLGCIGILAAQPVLAQTTGEALPWGAELGITGAALGLVYLAFIKTLPDIHNRANDAVIKAAEVNAEAVHAAAAVTAEAIDKMTSKLDSVESAISYGSKAQLELLTDIALRRKPNNGES